MVEPAEQEASPPPVALPPSEQAEFGTFATADDGEPEPPPPPPPPPPPGRVVPSPAPAPVLPAAAAEDSEPAGGGSVESAADFGDRGDELERAWKALPWGKIAFEPNRTMRQGVAEPVTVRIARGEAPDILKDWPGTRGSEPPDPGAGGEGSLVRVERIKTSGMMEVELVSADPEAFSIEPPGAQKQPIVGEHTDFQWLVTPLKAGSQTLQLRVVAEIPDPEMGPQRRVETKRAEIHVEVNTPYLVKGWMSRNWQWLLGSPIFLGFLGWLGKRFGARSSRAARA